MNDLISNSKRRVRISGDGPGPLQTAVSYCRDEIVRLLLENGFDPNDQDQLGETPMHCLQDSTELTELLFEFGGEMRYGTQVVYCRVKWQLQTGMKRSKGCLSVGHKE